MSLEFTNKRIEKMDIENSISTNRPLLNFCVLNYELGKIKGYSQIDIWASS